MYRTRTYRRDFGDVLAVLVALTAVATAAAGLLGRPEVAIWAGLGLGWAVVAYLAHRHGGTVVVADTGWRGTGLGELRVRRLGGWWRQPLANLASVGFHPVGETRAGHRRWRLVATTTGGQVLPTPTVVVGPTGEAALAGEFGGELLAALRELGLLPEAVEAGFGYALEA